MEIQLRAPEAEDVDRLFLWENDPGLFESLPHSAPLSRMQVWNYVQNYNADPFATGELRLMIYSVDEAKVVGYLDMFEFDAANRRAGVAIYIDEESRGAGVATAALRAFESYAENTLGLHCLWVMVALDNKISNRLFTKCGFKPSGKLRSWIRRGAQYSDVLIMQKLFS